MLLVFQPPLIPAALSTMRLQSFEAGTLAEIFHGSRSRLAVVPPQKRTSGVQSFAILSGKRAEAAEAGYVTVTPLGNEGSRYSVFVFQS